MRAQAAWAILLFVSNIANLVIAPQAVGWASDRLAPTHGSESLRMAMLPLTLVGFWAAVHFGVAPFTCPRVSRSSATNAPGFAWRRSGLRDSKGSLTH
ncbi:MAG: hypothetical protein U1F35_11720 [Steroidobacteraceae bacterium]